VGTETDGSVVSPASYNGLVGIKPTVGLVSRSGIIPISKTQDTAGPMARTVKDAAILLGVLAGIDEKDEVTGESRGKAQKDYTKFLDEQGLKGKRIGIEKSFLEGRAGVSDLYRSAIELMKENGAVIVPVNVLKSYYEGEYPEFTVFLYEFKDGLNRYLSKANARVKSLADVIAFNKENEASVMPYFKQETLLSSQAKGGLDSKEYIDAVGKQSRIRLIINNILQQNKLTAICSTTAGLPCTIDLINGDYDTGFYFGTPAAASGYPHITVPMGQLHDLPVGLSFMGGAYSEPEILKIAFSYDN
jgi:amidase